MLKLIEFFLVHEVSLKVIGLIVLNLTMSVLPLVLPMSLLFAVLLTYSRLSANSETVALKAIGYSPRHLSLPAVLFSILIAVLSIQTLFYLGPSARWKFDQVLHEIGSQKVMSSVQPGTFSESFFDLVLYANRIDQKSGQLEDLFIFDNRNQESPVAIVAKKGSIKSTKEKSEQRASVLLTDGYIHQIGALSRAKVKFADYSITIADANASSRRNKDLDTYTMTELKEVMNSPDTKKDFMKSVRIEAGRRWVLSLACIIFGFLGFSLGTKTNRRSGASSGFVLSVACIIGYWISYMIGFNLAKSIHPTMVWTPNILFLVLTAYMWRRQNIVD